MSAFRHHPSIGVTDLARQTGLLPSDVHRILNSLRPYGFIEQNPKTRTYHLGVGLMKLGLAAFQRHEIREAARPLLQRLSEELDATAHLAILDRRELDIFLAEQIDYSREVPFQAKFGATAGAHCTALGKAIMASVPWETVTLFIEKHGIRKVTPQTITEIPRLKVDLDQTAARGYGLDLEESARGACCVGAPIRDWDGATVGAISISMASSRYYRAAEASIAVPVKATAAHLSAAISVRRGTDVDLSALLSFAAK